MDNFCEQFSSIEIEYDMTALIPATPLKMSTSEDILNKTLKDTQTVLSSDLRFNSQCTSSLTSVKSTRHFCW